jgi:Cof subfamily protein (haloacid dehalogenase superfamily)
LNTKTDFTFMHDKLNGKIIRALCTDIDGTLLDSRRELSDNTIEAIRKLSASMPVILASSRMPSAMRHLQNELGISEHPLICYNGGYVLRYDSDGAAHVLYSAHIPINICTEILTFAKVTSVHISLYQQDKWFAPKIDEWTTREATITKVTPVIKPGDQVLDLWRLSGEGAHKVMIMGAAGEIQNLEAMLTETFSTDLHIYHSKSTYLEIAPKVISKSSALELLLGQLYGIDPLDVIAFGDNYNDIALLQSVGLGIAVGNARQEVKAVAKEITLDSNQDGVAVAIYKHLLSK